ncbi:hypothetical protein B0H19DRAFT_1085112 [Mycena capillaripes]|nr:hypothetical protein B0H19DRAFT_1085112 [Mycena capillaripes]
MLPSSPELLKMVTYLTPCSGRGNFGRHQGYQEKAPNVYSAVPRNRSDARLATPLVLVHTRDYFPSFTPNIRPSIRPPVDGTAVLPAVRRWDGGFGRGSIQGQDGTVVRPSIRPTVLDGYGDDP